jgi:hypothetical protein
MRATSVLLDEPDLMQRPEDAVHGRLGQAERVADIRDSEPVRGGRE